MKQTIGIVILLFLSNTLFSTDLDPDMFEIDWEAFNQEDNQSSQLAMNRAAFDEYQRSDMALNEIYREIMETYNENENLTAHLKDAQRKWLEFRNSHMDSIYLPDLNWGSMLPMTFYLDAAEITWTRVEQLYRWLDPDSRHKYHGSYGMHEKSEYAEDDYLGGQKYSEIFWKD